MNILQRRTKSSASTPSALSGHIGNYQEVLWSRWQALSSRDQLALTLLSVFLLLFVGGYGGYSVHNAANDSKTAYQEQVADYFWLRSQASNIDSNATRAATASDGDAPPPASAVSSLLRDSGIDNAQVVAAGDAVQLSFTHPSQAVVSAALGKLEQQGWQFTQLTMQQDLITKSLEVQATVIS